MSKYKSKFQVKFIRNESMNKKRIIQKAAKAFPNLKCKKEIELVRGLYHYHIYQAATKLDAVNFLHALKQPSAFHYYIVETKFGNFARDKLGYYIEERKISTITEDEAF